MRLGSPFVFILIGLLLACCSTREQTTTKDGELPTDSLISRADKLFAASDKLTAGTPNDSIIQLLEEGVRIKTAAGIRDTVVIRQQLRIAALYMNEYKFSAAIPYLEAVIASPAFAELSPDKIIRTNFSLSQCKIEVKDFPTALSITLSIRDSLQKNRPHDITNMSRVYYRLASIDYYQKNYPGTRAYIDQMLKIVPPTDYNRISVALMTYSLSYYFEKDYKSALKHIARALTNERKNSDDSPTAATLYLQKSYMLFAAGLNDSAVYCMRKNLSISQKRFGEKHSNTFGALYSLADMFEQQGKIDSAATYYQTALVALCKEFNSKRLEDNPKPGTRDMTIDLVQGLVRKGKILTRLPSVDEDRVRLAQRTLALADSVFAVFRMNLVGDDPQLRQLEQNYIPYASMVDNAFRLFESSHDDQDLMQAFKVMERSRAVVLQSSLSRAEDMSRIGVNADLRNKEKSLIKQRQEVIQQMSLDTSERVKLNAKLLEIDRENEKLRQQMLAVYPNYVSARYGTTEFSTADIQQMAKSEQVLIMEYLWSDSSIYAVCIGPSTIKHKTIRRTRFFNEALAGFTKSLVSTQQDFASRDLFENYVNSSFFLYQQLVEGLLPEAPPGGILISADGGLSTFPFEALIVTKPSMDEVNYHLPYLINDFKISYASSIDILMRQRSIRRHGDRLLAFGYAGSTKAQDRDAVSDLPGTAKELEAIKASMSNGQNEFLLLDDASESAFKKKVSNFDVVHLAVHGISDTLNELNSRLIFRHREGEDNDGNLYAHELYDLDLSHLDLAVLSACESGIGKRQTGEGMMSIARGFAYSGCPSLIISLWKIDDEHSSKVMGNFYRHLSESERISEAMANAKLEYINDANEFNSHPAFWASFLAMGNTRSVKSGLSTTSWILIGLAGVLALFVFRRVYRTV